MAAIPSPAWTAPWDLLETSGKVGKSVMYRAGSSGFAWVSGAGDRSRTGEGGLSLGVPHDGSGGTAGRAATDSGLLDLGGVLGGPFGGVPPEGGTPHGTGVPPGVTGGAPALGTGGGVLGPLGHGLGSLPPDLGGVPGGLLVAGLGGGRGPNTLSADGALPLVGNAKSGCASAGGWCSLGCCGAGDGAPAPACTDITSILPWALTCARHTVPFRMTSIGDPTRNSPTGEDRRLLAETSDGSDSAARGRTGVPGTSETLAGPAGA